MRRWDTATFEAVAVGVVVVVVPWESAENAVGEAGDEAAAEAKGTDAAQT
jgi:hypothetical protein